MRDSCGLYHLAFAFVLSDIIVVAEKPNTMGVVEFIATVGSLILLIVTLPFSLFFCFKVSETVLFLYLEGKGLSDLQRIHLDLT